MRRNKSGSALTERPASASVDAPLSKLDECVSEIIRLEREGGADAVTLSEIEADTFLAPFSRDGANPSAADERHRLTDELRELGPKTPLMDQIIAAIEKGTPRDA